MKRRSLLRALCALPTPLLIPVLARANGARADVGRLEKTEAEWRRILPAERYRILFEEATEPAGSSPLNAETRAGTYVCAACRLPLFESEHKYDSGTGWPSFTQPIAGAVDTKLDFKLIWPRTEYHCARCGGHQGHVFDDGPPPRGERWCNNGLALVFVPQGQPLPELRT
jgi:peptide-methionine (R)-S-oxide reductase